MLKKIAILMATYNGEKFLHKQLDSIIRQSHPLWCLYVLDDGSTDKTWEILQSYQARYGSEKIKISRQINQGSTKTFLTLVCDQNIQADYYAYTDQDDIWDESKLQVALNILTKKNSDLPNLYCATARLINENDEQIGFLPIKKRPLKFTNALVQCCATGNTMVFNQAARRLVQTIGPVNIAGNHDWWTYLAISAYESFIYYDSKPMLSYRLHQKNVVGFIDNYFGRYFKRLKKVLSDEFINANEQHIVALNKIKNDMSDEAKKALALFMLARQGNLIKRLFYLYKSRVYRQEITGTIALYICQLLKKF